MDMEKETINQGESNLDGSSGADERQILRSNHRERIKYKRRLNSYRRTVVFSILGLLILLTINIIFPADHYYGPGGESSLSGADKNGISASGNDGQSAEDADLASAPAERKEVIANALYITGSMAGSKTFIDNIVEKAGTTKLNAVVIDVKEDGIVNYESNVEEVVTHQNFKKVYDPEEVVGKLHDAGLYVIGRVVCFRDKNYAVQRTDLTVKKADGEPFKEGEHYWLNAYKEECQRYNLDIAKEAISHGFDEIQFDYVRFPATTKANYGNPEMSKCEAIISFLSKAHEEISVGLNKPISADLFGIAIESKLDGDAIGHDFVKIGEVVDYICPMIYPSHWANASPTGTMSNGTGQVIYDQKFTAPDLDPYGVTYKISLKAKEKMAENPNFKAKIRLYLQDFTASYLPRGYYKPYGANEVNDQIRGLTDAGFEEWILWSGTNKYSYEVFNE